MNPTCFISYSWDSEPHRIWVRSLAERLQSSGVKTYLDQWDVQPGADLTRYMEASIRESEFVLLICTPSFAEKANAGLGGVGYEKLIVTGEIFGRVSPETKFVPLLRAGDGRTALPSYLRSKVFIDFRRDHDFARGFELLLRHLHRAPESQRPPLGPKPPFTTPPSQPSQQPEGPNPKFELSAFESVYRYAYGGSGLNLSKDRAIAWAEDKTKWAPPFDLQRFKKLYDYAYGGSGLNLSKDQAIAWAEQNMRAS